MHPRGDVKLELDGETYQLRATFGNMANYQAAVGVIGLPPLLEMLGSLDARALMHGVQCLAIKGDTDKVPDLDFSDCETQTQQKILEAITGSTLTGDEEGEPDPNPESEGK